MPSFRKYLAEAYESKHGPLPDPVAAFGAHLVSAPPTPFKFPQFDESFYTGVVYALRLLESRMIVRTTIYGAEAEESRIAARKASELRETG